MSKRVAWPGLVFVFLCAWALRLYGLNWDQGHGLHPDERYVTWVAASLGLPDRPGAALDSDRSPLNPYRWPPDGRSAAERTRPFSYGHFPLYLLALVAGGDGDEARLALVGRILSALFDTATVALTFALARRLYGERVGLLAAAFLALTVLHIQLAHFATFDPALTCLVVAALLFAVRRNARLAGLCFGLALGTKFGAALLILPLALAFERRSLLAVVGLALLAFAATNPYALLQPGEFVANLRDQAAMLRGDENYVFTYQYHGAWAYLYPIQQHIKWGMGLPLGLAAWGGLAWALAATLRAEPQAEAWRRPRAGRWVVLSWVLLYFGFTGGLHTKFMRYMLPITPLLAVYGAAALRAVRGRLGGLLTGGVLLSTFLYALAFTNVYRGEHPWVRLSRWVYANVAPGATLAFERWDHQLPLTLEQNGRVRWPGEFGQQALDSYAPDTPEKLRRMLEQLAASDYLIIASNRLYGSTAHYPLTRRVYQFLFEGHLGYQLIPLPGVARHPRLGPLALVADPFRAAGLPNPLPQRQQRPAPVTLSPGRADESFTVYDHPLPLLFQNVERLSMAQMGQRLSDSQE
jgi:4-amino-4-deoxy-L-arabinose transferase-like glycosyltransferase